MKTPKPKRVLRQGALFVMIALVCAAAIDYRASTTSTLTREGDLRQAFRRPSSIPYPDFNPYTEEKYQLGRKLFFEPRVSQAGKLSCASCHNPYLNWTDGLGRRLGLDHHPLRRKVPTLLNAAWGWSYFWDGRARNLEEQALGPIQAEVEMNMKLPVLVQRLSSIPEYHEAFARAFPGRPISGETIAKSIATFERTIVSGPAPFDYWVAGDERAISDSAKRGFLVFNDKAGCVRCHTGWRLTNGMFADIGLPTEDLGRGPIDHNPYVNYSFKTPTLRNIALRAPYMHDGSMTSLREVVEHYNRGGRADRPTAHYFLKPLHLTEREKNDLLAFLDTLTSEEKAVTVSSREGAPEGEKWGKQRELLSTR